jgi:Fe-S-cluster-containing hydrogenase component 2
MNLTKASFLFFSPERCTGCRSCEMICSLVQTGSQCSPATSCIHVNSHPYLYSPAISISLNCNCSDGKEQCIDICNQDAIVFVPQKEAPAMLKDKEWWPAAIVSALKTPDVRHVEEAVNT